MISRLRRFVGRTRHAPARIDALERVHDLDIRRFEALEQRVAALAESEVPQLFLTAEAALESRLRAIVHQAAASARDHTEAASGAAERNAIDAAREHTNAGLSALQALVLDMARTQTSASIAELRREVATFRRVAAAPAPSTAPSTGHDAPVGAPHDPALYVALEDRFRGAPELIAARQRAYLPLVEHLAGTDVPLLDLGCGRGEWLSVVGAAGVTAVGVDSNPAFAAEVRDTGATLVEADLVAHLRAAPDASAGAITMFQVVEHLPFDVLFDVLVESVRVLQPGGVLIAETPNALNLTVAASTFWLDPTHQRPLHPELLQFLAGQAGFARTEGRFLNELRPIPDEVTDPVQRRLLDLVDGPGDFALIAWA